MRDDLFLRCGMCRGPRLFIIPSLVLFPWGQLWEILQRGHHGSLLTGTCMVHSNWEAKAKSKKTNVSNRGWESLWGTRPLDRGAIPERSCVQKTGSLLAGMENVSEQRGQKT